MRILKCFNRLFEGFSASNKDLLALHNGAWSTSAMSGQNSQEDKRNSNSEGGQEKIIRAFAEVMKNMQRMKTYVRPAMCKPYGKQSEALQKSKVFHHPIVGLFTMCCFF